MHEIFVNTTIDDGTDIADLMACFTKKEVKNPKFPKLSGEVQRLKETEGGLSTVCELMEKYNQEAIQEHDYEAIAEMLRDNVSSEKICQYLHVTEEDIQVVKSSLFQLN